jgi:hypothetical protein
MSKIAKEIAKHLTACGWSDKLLYFWAGTTVPRGSAELKTEIDRVLKGKTIPKSELEALRKDVANMVEAQKAYNYVDGLNNELRRKNANQSTMLVEAWDTIENLNLVVAHLRAQTEDQATIIGNLLAKEVTDLLEPPACSKQRYANPTPTNPIEVKRPKAERAKTFFKNNASRIAVGILLGALIGMTVLFVREAHIIQDQRDLVLQLWDFIQAGCPSEIVQ